MIEGQKYNFGVRVVGGVYTDDNETTKTLYSDIVDVEGTPKANEKIIEFSEKAKYGIVSGKNAMNITGFNYAPAEVNAIYKNDSIIGDNVKFTITPQDDESLSESEVKVMIQCYVGDDSKPYPLITENEEKAFADNDNGGRYDGKKEIYIINKTGVNQGTIKSVSVKKYATIDNGELKFKAADENAATKFTFLKDPTVFDTSFSIEHKKTGKYLVTDGTLNKSLTVDGDANSENVRFSKFVFSTTGRHVTASLISKKYGLGIKSGGIDTVQMTEKIEGTGNDSICIIPNGDGTISFKDVTNNKYITVEEKYGKPVLVCNKFDGETPTDNEKFIIHTYAPPHSVSDLKVSTKFGSETSIKLLWKNPECLFTGIEIYQKKEDETTFNKIAALSNVESYNVTNLEKGKNYTFKVRVLIGDAINDLYEDNEISATPTAKSDIIQFSETSNYGIVAIDSDHANKEYVNKALNIKAAGWQNPATFNATYKDNTNTITGDNAKFIITPQTDENGKNSEIKVMMESIVGEQTYPLRAENGTAFADSEGGNGRYDGYRFYIIEKTGDNEGIIKSVINNSYAIINDNGELSFDADAGEDYAQRFKFIENPTVLSSSSSTDKPEDNNTSTIENLNLSLEHVKTGKYIYTKENGKAITVNGDGKEEDVLFNKIVFGNSTTETEAGINYNVVSLVSKKHGTGLQSIISEDGVPKATYVKTTDKKEGKGWETIRIVGNGDGTISLKDSYYDKLITVNREVLKSGEIDKGKAPTDNEKFRLHVAEADTKALTPRGVTQLSVGEKTNSSIELSWKNPLSIFTGIEVYKKTSDSDYEKVTTLGDAEKYTVTGLKKGVEYNFKLHVVCNVTVGDDEKTLASSEEEVSAKTRFGEKPATPSNVHLTEANGKLKLTWDKVANAAEYKIQRAPSLYGNYTDVDVKVTDNTVELTPEGNKYSNYYRIVALSAQGDDSDVSKPVSLETELFGEHTIFFAPTDDFKKIDEVLMDIFKDANDFEHDAQFNGEQWQIYFKPGDYTKASCMYLGFYTSFNGLGKTPYDVKLNNIAIPAYLPVGSLGSSSPFILHAENIYSNLCRIFIVT